MGIRARIRQLERNLSAEIVLQEEINHIEVEEKASYTHGIWDDWTESVKVIDQPRITQPDTEKREKAKAELKQIYDNSKWYQVFVRGRIRSTLERYKQPEQKPQSESSSEDDDRDESGPKMCERRYF